MTEGGSDEMRVIPADKVIYSFKPDMEAVARIDAGEVVKFQTCDCWHGQITSEQHLVENVDFSILNPATGPVYVEGAQPGDLLKVKIVKFDLAKQGVSNVVPNGGVLGHKVSRPVTRIIPIVDGTCRFLDMSLPVRPMIGVIGVAPSQADGECPTGTPWKHGGNMDTTDIGEGSTLYLPVRQPGALLAMGDVHAVMGDGEICFTGCEIAAEIMVHVDLVKAKGFEWPLVETDTHTMIITSGDTLDDAATAASEQAVECLSRALGLSWEDAYMLASLIMDLKISQFVDPKRTVRAAIPKSVVPTELLIRKA